MDNSERKIVVECDEMWSFVGKKANKAWIWLAMDVATRQIIGVHIGNRSAEDASKLLKSIPEMYRKNSEFIADKLDAYTAVFPGILQVDKGSGLTNHIERFNCTMRQRIGRLVRKTLSFSKKLNNHVGSIWNFIHYYNQICISSVL